ncbi:HlyD family efflux transporter periplasmic adaptor subunit [Altererythrobacter endophyticus]|uniref:HlyD family efflux transporter periplasmic adaptor subunit n=2 Tax=Altericroceibacterium endophyticum TaxID=1808508 RepID=A0A6I4T7K8_9SPHN|nr:HlyD family efflux transporter periplasmic adaptor subunit [Altericroceibacterium endophyticum]
MEQDQDMAPEPSEQRIPPLKRRGVRLVLLGIVIVLAILAVVWFIQYQTVGKYMQSTDDAYIQADSVTVAPKISGYVDEVFVDENETVKKGDPLARIDPRDYEASAEQAQAQIDVSRANAAGVRAQVSEQQAAVNSAKASLAAAQADFDFARSEVSRYEPLVATGAEPKQILSQKRNQLQQSLAQVASARAELTAARRRVATLEAQVRQAQAQGEAGEAQLSQANVNLGSTLLEASIDGRIGNKTVRVGQFVQSGTRMMSIVPVKQIYIKANFKETQLGMMRPGQPVTIEVDALKGIELHGHVESIAPGTGAQFSLLPPENATGNFTKIVQRIPVRIAVDASEDTKALFVPGMSVEVTVDTRSAEGELNDVQADEAQRSQARN